MGTKQSHIPPESLEDRKWKELVKKMNESILHPTHSGPNKEIHSFLDLIMDESVFISSIKIKSRNVLIIEHLISCIPKDDRWIPFPKKIKKITSSKMKEDYITKLKILIEVNMLIEVLFQFFEMKRDFISLNSIYREKISEIIYFTRLQQTRIDKLMRNITRELNTFKEETSKIYYDELAMRE